MTYSLLLVDLSGEPGTATVPETDPLQDDPATTQPEINEHGDGVRWSFGYWDGRSRPV